MIEFLTGKIARHSPTHVILDVNGVGYGLNMSLQGSTGLTPGQAVSLHTYLSVKEDSMTLFAFQEQLEKDLFLKLIDVTGIGPKLAQRVLSETTPSKIIDLIVKEDELGLTKLKGIGRKTAGLLVLNLKSKLLEVQLNNHSSESLVNPIAADAISALTSLGLKEPSARKAVDKALKMASKDGISEIDLSQLITQALKFA